MPTWGRRTPAPRPSEASVSGSAAQRVGRRFTWNAVRTTGGGSHRQRRAEPIGPTTASRDSTERGPARTRLPPRGGAEPTGGPRRTHALPRGTGVRRHCRRPRHRTHRQAGAAAGGATVSTLPHNRPASRRRPDRRRATRCRNRRGRRCARTAGEQRREKATAYAAVALASRLGTRISSAVSRRAGRRAERVPELARAQHEREQRRESGAGARRQLGKPDAVRPTRRTGRSHPARTQHGELLHGGRLGGSACSAVSGPAGVARLCPGAVAIVSESDAAQAPRRTEIQAVCEVLALCGGRAGHESHPPVSNGARAGERSAPWPGRPSPARRGRHAALGAGVSRGTPRCSWASRSPARGWRGECAGAEPRGTAPRPDAVPIDAVAGEVLDRSRTRDGVRRATCAGEPSGSPALRRAATDWMRAARSTVRCTSSSPARASLAVAGTG
jgi:hypothetical protein